MYIKIVHSLTFASTVCKKNTPLKRATDTEPPDYHYFFPLSLRVVF